MIGFCNGKSDDELSESNMQAFEAFIYRCPKEMSDYLEEITQLSSQCLSHDPNYHYDDEDDNVMNGQMETDGKREKVVTPRKESEEQGLFQVYFRQLAVFKHSKVP